MIKQAMALANHPMNPFIRIYLSTHRAGRAAVSHSCKPDDFKDWIAMAIKDGEQLTVTKIEWEAFAHGGYEIHYIAADCGVLCHQCANANIDQTLLQEGDDGFDKQWGIISADVNYESTGLCCDHCATVGNDPDAEWRFIQGAILQ